MSSMAEDTTPDKAVSAAASGAADTASTPAAAASALPPATVPEPDTGYTAHGVPTLEGVREKIENRYGTALGATELAENTPEVRSAAERYDTIQKAAAEKLDEIRASMHEKD